MLVYSTHCINVHECHKGTYIVFTLEHSHHKKCKPSLETHTTYAYTCTCTFNQNNMC